MKYIIITGCKGSEWTEEHETKEQAIKAADKEYNHMNECDKKNTSYMYILESVNPDEDAPNHFDGDIVKTYIDNTN